MDRITWIDLEPVPSGSSSALAPASEFAGWVGSFPLHERRPDEIHDGLIRRAMRPFSWLGARMIAPPGDDLRRWHSTDVTCRVGRSATEAIEALARTGAIEWGRGRRPNRLSIERIRQERNVRDGPRLADAVIRGHRTGELDLTIAVFEGNRNSCIVQLRRSGRSTWGVRRRRRCMTATHDAADRLIEQILAVDFRPPAAAAPPPAH